MRISIGHRLFASVLLAILAVAATGIWLMRHKVIDSFADYAVNIELDRLDELAGALGGQYTAQGGWGFLPSAETARAGWIARELARLQQRRLGAASQPAPPAPAGIPAPRTTTQATQSVAARVAAPVPPEPPMPPAPPAPPLPPPVVPPEPPEPPAPQAAIDSLGLQDRVTLLDAAGAYLAGRRPDSQPGARRTIMAGGQPVGFLLVAKAQRPSDAMASAFLQQLRDSLLIIVAASIALSALAAVLLAAHFRKPIHRLADGARELAAGRFDTRLPVARSDELGELAHSFNQLAQKLSMAEESRRQWVADTSHELRTPLSVLRAQLEAIQDGVRPASPDTVAAMLRQVLALNKLIDELYALARADVGAPEYQRAPLDLWALAMQEASAFEHKLAAAGLTLELGVAPAAATVLADPDRMRQVFTNLLENCVRYTAPGGKVALHARRDGARLLIEIDDSAPGVPGDALARLSERFFRVEASRSRAQGGAGLGLALCRRIVEAHGGQLTFAHSPLGGLRVTLALALEAA